MKPANVKLIDKAFTELGYFLEMKQGQNEHIKKLANDTIVLPGRSKPIPINHVQAIQWTKRIAQGYSRSAVKKIKYIQKRTDLDIRGIILKALATRL